jgi:hypothetical protein
MAKTLGTNDEFSTDPGGVMARYERKVDTDSSGIGGSGISIGGVGMPVRTMTGQTLGRGVGATVSTPIGGVRRAKGGKVKKMAKGGSTASKRADGCCTKGKTKGRFV